MRYDNVAKMLHWKLCKKWGFNKAEKWYIHKPEKVLESENCKIFWDFPIQTDKTLEHNRPDITVIDKKSKKCMLIDPACPFNTRIERKKKNAEVWDCKHLGNEKGKIYNGSNRVIRNSNKALWEMDREIRLELHDWSITEALSTWNGENNTKSVG